MNRLDPLLAYHPSNVIRPAIYIPKPLLSSSSLLTTRFDYLFIYFIRTRRRVKNHEETIAWPDSGCGCGAPPCRPRPSDGGWFATFVVHSASQLKVEIRVPRVRITYFREFHRVRVRLSLSAIRTRTRTYVFIINIRSREFGIQIWSQSVRRFLGKFVANFYTYGFFVVTHSYS